MPLDAGELNRQIVLQEMADSIGGSGYPVETWTTLDALVWASRDDISGKERFAAAQISAPFDCRWQIYYRCDMDPELLDVTKTRRILYQGRTLRITSATLIGFQEGIELLTLGSTAVPA